MYRMVIHNQHEVCLIVVTLEHLDQLQMALEELQLLQVRIVMRQVFIVQRQYRRLTLHYYRFV